MREEDQGSTLECNWFLLSRCVDESLDLASEHLESLIGCNSSKLTPSERVVKQSKKIGKRYARVNPINSPSIDQKDLIGMLKNKMSHCKC